ncbi:substrate-binding domain-containing protein [Pusillimonas sp.]|uniref:substrate-binding domain-containing protein n=1 Tax=Pusillimonas sp. TaxID=3040095 RepID=UPI0029BB6CB5|nr:substrate-binding domain-containing protein [Pusillimonas sp.]MDX3895826.1 substrate-binding domain-containing protein [Pusillimonas sp.]
MKRHPTAAKRFNMVFKAAALALAAACFAPAQAADKESADRLQGLIEPIKAEKPFKIGVTLVHLQDDFWKGIAYGIQDEAKRSGVELAQVTVAGAYGNVREQFGQLNALKTLGVDYVALGPASFDGYDPIIKSLKDAGIKTLAVGIPVNSANIAFGVGQDEEAIGAALAKAICDKKPDSTTLTIPGPAGAEWARLRYVAFQEQAKQCQGMKVIPGSFGGGVDLGYGLSQASDLLLRTPDANFIYTPVIPLGMGAVQAVRQQRRDVKVVSSAIVREAIPMIQDGRFLAVTSEPGILMGRLLVQYAIRDHEGKNMENLKKDDALPYPYALTPPVVVTPENVDSFPFEVYELPPKGWSITALQ